MENRSKNIMLGVLVVGLLSMTIAYAALSSNLRISGTASVAAATWDIRISNLTKASSTPSLVSGQTNTASGPASVAATNNTGISGLNVTLNQPGDKVVYNFTISNNGTIDAELSSFTSSLTKNSASPTNISASDIASKFSHSISCSPTQATSSSDYLNKSGSDHSSSSCTLTIAWKEATQANQTPGQDQTYTQGAVILDYNAQWVYIQK